MPRYVRAAASLAVAMLCVLAFTASRADPPMVGIAGELHDACVKQALCGRVLAFTATSTGGSGSAMYAEAATKTDIPIVFDCVSITVDGGDWTVHAAGVTPSGERMYASVQADSGDGRLGFVVSATPSSLPCGGLAVSQTDALGTVVER